MECDFARPRDRPLFETLAGVARALNAAREPWWIIGSAAVRLHGADTDVADVDVLLSVGDARSLLETWSVTMDSGGGTDLFRSTVFGRYAGLPLVVEVMAGFEVMHDGGWQVMRPVGRQQRIVSGHAVYFPPVAELAAMCEAFGRPKDRERARLLRAVQQ